MRTGTTTLSELVVCQVGRQPAPSHRQDEVASGRVGKFIRCLVRCDNAWKKDGDWLDTNIRSRAPSLVGLLPWLAILLEEKNASTRPD